MSIVYLEIIAVAAFTLVLARCLLPLIRWSVELVDAKHRRRHAARRRSRRKGYLPVYDEDWKP